MIIMIKKELYAAPETKVLMVGVARPILTSDQNNPGLGDSGLGGGSWQ